ncbi:ubiquinone biosynthesis accessory factor UbiJ [Pleionea sediminis]|uniref:ubiquinone biosynthesis accessory factor UbiJ n=1 Tax=Pleionea sediminis TaxID=2569479 RepID=UPI0011856806|nr:SCP2 sterol-binding domain-containing protein [Pleionea sediminis]
MLTLNLVTASALEKVINHWVFLDPEISEKRKPLIQKRVAIKLTDWNLTYVFDFNEESIAIDTQVEAPSQVTLSGTSFAFFNMARQEHGGDALFKGDIHFEGEVGTAQLFQAFWQSIDVDWEEELSKYTGDIVAHHAGNFVRSAHKTLKNFFITAQQNVSEYVREEANMSPSPIEVELFYNELDDLKSDIDRLASRIEKLNTKL